MKTKLFYSFLIVGGLFLAGCEGEVGPQGPQGAKGDTGAAGPQGPQGPSGANGAQGATGAQGPAGTANVIYSDWTALPTTPSAKGSNYKEYAVSAPKLTKEVFDTGMVFVYARSGGSASMFQLPYTFVNSYTSSVRLTQGFVIYGEDWTGGGTVSATWLNAARTDYFSHIRYVIIPGGQKARVAGLDYSNYEVVKRYYNIQD